MSNGKMGMMLKMMEILSNLLWSTSNWPVLIRNVRVLQDSETLKNGLSSKETKEAWQLNVMCDPGLQPGLGEKNSVKDIIGKIDEIWI